MNIYELNDLIDSLKVSKDRYDRMVLLPFYLKKRKELIGMICKRISDDLKSA